MWKQRSEGSRALPRVYVKDPAGVHVDEVEDLMGHRVKARPRLDVVVVVVSDEDAGGVHGKRPETVEVDLLAHLHRSSHEHQAAAEPLGADALHRPETLHVEEVLRVEEEHASLGVEVVQHVLDSERHVRVAGVVESGEHHRRVLVVLEDFVERSPPFLQLLKSVTREMTKPKRGEDLRQAQIERQQDIGCVALVDILQYLSVIMLGFIVTRSVFVPTSAMYLSLMGGMLHLQEKKKSPTVEGVQLKWLENMSK